MERNAFFESVDNWAEAGEFIDFQPRCPAYTAGFSLESLSIHVMDHRKRRLPVSRRSLEAHFGGFVIDQTRFASANQARKQALSIRYGQVANSIDVSGNEGRSYARGPVPDEDDPDGRDPAVIVWNEGERFFLVTSVELDDEELYRVASSMYKTGHE